MDLVRVGLAIRALRRRRGWTQTELGVYARCSKSEISRIERGQDTDLARIERILGALGARLSIKVLFQGEELDRTLDRDHATLVNAMVELLSGHGWLPIPEATFQVYGERGSIDILAWHPITRILLVIEAKSVVPDVQATLAGVDRKARLAPSIGRDRGWEGTSVARLLVLPDDRTARRRIDAVGATFDRALPARTREVRRWLRQPSGPLAGVLFLPISRLPGARHRVGRHATRPTLDRSGRS
jgi:transcriptional regulator with XRE-family HTH domain